MYIYILGKPLLYRVVGKLILKFDTIPIFIFNNALIFTNVSISYPNDQRFAFLSDLCLSKSTADCLKLA